MSKNCIEQLKALKTHPEAGWVSSDAEKSAKTRLMSAIRNQGEQSEMEPLTNKGYYKWSFLHMIVKPVSFGAMIFVLAISGWMTTVNAASNSLPGDPLYGLKLVTERAQLTLASLDERAILHTEFASRRLQEVVAMDVNSIYFDETLEAFKNEMQIANNQLLQLQEDDDDTLISTASTIDEKIDSLSSGFDKLTDNDVQSTKEIAQQVSDSAVEVLVEEHENGASENSKIALAQSFKEQYNKLINRQTFDLGRIVVIDNAIDNGTVSIDVLGDDRLKDITFLVDSATSQIANAMDLAAAGGYRTAFEIIKEADTNLLDIESRLAIIEINITNKLSLAGSEDEVIDEVIDDVSTETVSDIVVDEK